MVLKVDGPEIGEIISRLDRIVELLGDNPRQNSRGPPNGLGKQSLLTVAEVADWTSMSRWTIYRMVSESRIPYVKLGASLRFDRAAVWSWIDANGRGRSSSRT